jgi:guanylate kinase
MPMTLLVIVGPSGAGKTSVGDGLRIRDTSVRWVRSYVTRRLRDAEDAGSGRIVVSHANFEFLVARNVFSWTTKNYAHRYGTSKEDILVATSCAQPLFLLDFAPRDLPKIDDLRGWVQVVCLLPPNLEALERRLRGDGRLNRLAEASTSYELCQKLHLEEDVPLIINEHLEQAVDDMQTLGKRAGGIGK